MTLGKHMRRGGIPLWGFSRSENDLQMLVKPPEVRTFSPRVLKHAGKYPIYPIQRLIYKDSPKHRKPPISNQGPSTQIREAVGEIFCEGLPDFDPSVADREQRARSHVVSTARTPPHQD